MKTTPSTPVVELRKRRSPANRLAVGLWEEEAFPLSIRQPEPLVTAPILDWELVEAIGAADDASRFRIDTSGETLAEAQP